GGKLYVDRNANGDLTDAHELFRVPEQKPHPGGVDSKKETKTTTDGGNSPSAVALVSGDSWGGFRIPDLLAVNGKSRYTDLRVDWRETPVSGGDPEVNCRLHLRVGDVEQYTLIKARATKPGDAPVVHFDGPLHMELRVEPYKPQQH